MLLTHAAFDSTTLRYSLCVILRQPTAKPVGRTTPQSRRGYKCAAAVL